MRWEWDVFAQQLQMLTQSVKNIYEKFKVDWQTETEMRMNGEAPFHKEKLNESNEYFNYYDENKYFNI
jgi:hypothetical protein